LVTPAESSESSAEDLYEHAPCGYLSARPDGTIIRINRTLLGWLGYERAELIDRRTFQSLLAIGARVYYETHYGPLLTMQGAVHEIAVELLRRDGSRLPALVNSVLHTDESGAPIVVRTTVFDATFRRRYERELLEARRAAEQSERQLTLVQKLVSDFAVALTGTDVAAVLTGRGSSAVGAVGSAVWLTVDDGAALAWVDGVTPPTEARVRRTPVADPAPHARASRTREPFAVRSAEEVASYAPLVADAAGAPDVTAVVFVPLAAADEVLGVVAFGYVGADPADAENRQLVQTLGRQAGQTLQRTGLFDAEKRLRRRAETLQLITAALAVPLDARQIAVAATERIQAAAGFDRVLFVLAGTPHPEAAAVEGFPVSIVDGWRRDPAALAPVMAWPVAEGTFIDADAAGTMPAGVVPAGFDGALAVLPLRAGPVVLGVLLLGRAVPRVFPPGERSFLRTFAGQCAQALERARLHAETVEREREATFIVSLSRRLDETPGLRRRAVELVAGLVPAAAGRARVAMLGDDGQLETFAVEPAGDVGDAATAESVSAAVRIGSATMATDPATGVCDVALPLRAQGRVTGVLVLGLASAAAVRDRYRFFTELAESAGLALENGRLYDQEHRNAHILQQGLLSGEPPYDPRITVTTWYRPAAPDLEVGGDWHDAFLVGPNRLAFVVGDVVGRGIRAAATMGHLRSAVRALAATDPGPAGLLDRLDRFVDRFEDGRMSTVAYGLLDLATGRLRYACAGHLPPLLTEPDGRLRFLWDGRSTPVAAYAGMKPRVEAEEQLTPGSRVLLYTDGLVERRIGNLHTDLARLANEAASRARAPQGLLLPDLAAALADTRDDDVCMLCVGYGAEPAFERRVLADVNRLKSVRDDLRAWLATVPVSGGDCDALLLGCSEAVANAMEHGYGNDGKGAVEVWAESQPGSIVLTVRDRGTWQSPDPDTDRGRGLILIRAMMTDVSVVHDEGTTVTMRRVLTSDGAP
jgi:PAS domain S-box-containing protein